MPRILKNLKINEVSVVRAAANHGAEVLIRKRFDGDTDERLRSDVEAALRKAGLNFEVDVVKNTDEMDRAAYDPDLADETPEERARRKEKERRAALAAAGVPANDPALAGNVDLSKIDTNALACGDH